MTKLFTEAQIKNAWFMIENKLPMTQLIFNTIMDGIMGLGDEVQALIERMIKEYPEYADVYAEAIDKEVEAANLPPMPAETKARIKKNLEEQIKKLNK